MSKKIINRARKIQVLMGRYRFIRRRERSNPNFEILLADVVIELISSGNKLSKQVLKCFGTDGNGGEK